MKKSALSLLFLFTTLFASAQYKRFTVGAFGMTNNFDSHWFYSSPGASLQYNFKKVFSLNVALNREKMKHSTVTYNDLQFNYSVANNALTYWNIPVSCRASFGRKVLVYAEVGAAFHKNYSIHKDGFVVDNFEDPQNPEYFSYSYYPNTSQKILFFGGVGSVVPVAKGFSVQLNASRSIYRQEEFYDHFVFINSTFSDTRGFVGFKFSVGLCYNFNVLKTSKYSFTTFYPSLIKND